MDITQQKALHYDEHIPVLIVGGGLIGLSQALFLQHQGVPFMLVERHAGTSILPRARGVHFRSMELYREIGLDQEIYRVGATTIKQGHFGGLRVGETLISAQAQQINLKTPGYMDKEIAPASFCFCPQDELEPVLLKAARARGGDIRFSTEMLSFEQDKEGVTAVLCERTTGKQFVVRADYMIAADGARSPIRRALKISTSGQGTLEHYLNIYFMADLSELVKGRTFSQCFIENEHVRGLFIALNNTDRWAFHLSYDPHKGEKPEDFPVERCIELLKRAIGVSEIAIEIKQISPWESAVHIADSYQQGRILLTGDAAHLMPPWGALGGTTGIADAHNLAWKLAAVYKGLASPTLLTTYEAERRPIACICGKQAALGTDIFTRYGVATENNAEDLKQLINPFLLIVGYQYRSRAIIANASAETNTDSLTLTGEQGTRVPHVWLRHEDTLVSTLDLSDKRFVLLTDEKGQAWCEVARALAERQGLPLRAYRIGPEGDLQDEGNKWQAAVGSRDGEALLLRPDGFVAWRSTQETPVTEESLAQVLKQLLGYQASSAQ
ncbi:hypothetical protein EPA93_19410 [Ktedonosporobacter rubrisoli]|uniref:FAD-binding domain-containing protein n=1 Tax=Ktedonosporobacter rubrisoli TaxID=2509675 RepID=A0A4P6JRQ9_KTERU|nr:FAD-dependent monooxygenase [Ktedonosporobacter rubrisoli]QBD78044.1 hypothetical protein EPA93_19410 [Ktedonosporobacter rubrisoli]